MTQFVVDGIIASAIYLLVGLSFLFIFAICRRFDFSLGALVSIGPYIALSTRPFLTLPAAICVGLASSGLLALLSQKYIYQSISARPGGELACLLASLGLYAFLQNVISLVYGDNRLTIRSWPVREGIPFLNARITVAQIMIVLAALLITVGLSLFMRLTVSGIKMRAVSDEPTLAKAVGIDVRKTYLLATSLAGIIAGAAGVLIACDVDMTPTMGLQPLMVGVAAVVIGKRTFLGTSLGALLLGVSQHMSIIWLPARWQDSVAFLVLLVFMVFRTGRFWEK